MLAERVAPERREDLLGAECSEGARRGVEVAEREPSGSRGHGSRLDHAPLAGPGVAARGDDHVVVELDPHDVAGALHRQGEPDVLRGGIEAPRRLVSDFRRNDVRVRADGSGVTCAGDGRRGPGYGFAGPGATVPGESVKLHQIGSGPPVVKLAGLAGGIGLFEEEMKAAAAAGFRVAALDTSGDRADDPAPGPITWSMLAGEVEAALDRMGVDRAVLWGTSFGCLVALAAAARLPRRVSGLLLCHPPEPGRRPAYQKLMLRRAERSRDPARAARRLFIYGFRFLTAWELVYPPLLRRLPALARASYEAATPASTFLDKLRLVAMDPPGIAATADPIPVSIVAGAWDLVTPLREARALAARLPGARLSVLRFSGHAGAFSRPRAYARLVVRELRWLAAPSGSQCSML